jgi:hypothetical protein
MSSTLLDEEKDYLGAISHYVCDYEETLTEKEFEGGRAPPTPGFE